VLRAIFINTPLQDAGNAWEGCASGDWNVGGVATVPNGGGGGKARETHSHHRPQPDYRNSITVMVPGFPVQNFPPENLLAGAVGRLTAPFPPITISLHPENRPSRGICRLCDAKIPGVAEA